MVSSFFGVSTVFVTSISFWVISFVPHSAQKVDVSGFSAPHLGHFTPIAFPLVSLVKKYQFTTEKSIRLDDQCRIM